MIIKKLFDVQEIARSNYLWHTSKTRINIILSATLLIALIGTIALL
jgi:hypothetical protein